MTPEFTAAAVALLLGLWVMTGSRRRARERLRRIESRVDVLFQQLGLDETAAPALSAEVRHLAERGQMIQAIRLHREENPGLGLKEARIQVDAFGGGAFGPPPRPDAERIVRKLDRVLESLDITPEGRPAPELPEAILELVREGRRIEAIKKLREIRPDLGLRQAKEIVEGLGRALG